MNTIYLLGKIDDEVWLGLYCFVGCKTDDVGGAGRFKPNKDFGWLSAVEWDDLFQFLNLLNH